MYLRTIIFSIVSYEFRSVIIAFHFHRENNVQIKKIEWFNSLSQKLTRQTPDMNGIN